MMAVKKKLAEIDVESFAESFVKIFGRPPTAEEFEEWCNAWGGEVEKNKCVFVYVET
jgi:arsenate reductase-like glutaredoxin family protein